LSLEGIAEYSTGLWMPLVLVLVISFLLCLLVVLLVSRTITKPLIQLRNDTQLIARGQYDDIRTLRTGDEIETLSGALVDMAQALKHSFSSITEKNSRLQAVFMAVPGGILAVDNDENIIMANPTARKMFSITADPEGKHFMEVVKNPRLESIVREAGAAHSVVEKEISLLRGMEEMFLQVFAVSVVNDSKTYGVILLAQDITRIRKLENMRSDFAANVSHELKTPLTVISGFIDTLKAPDISPQDAARFLDIISLESERLTRLIDDVLVLSDIENTAAIPVPLIDIRQGVSGAVQLLEQAAAEKGVTLTLDICDAETLVMADMDRIKQMVINLVDNAIKYTPQNGAVNVSVTKAGRHAVVTIEDNGIGIPAENIPRLFERFYRVDKSRSRALGGTGLGLAIVKHIVNLIGGHITVRSHVGEGTRFDVFLPIGQQK
jgi:two-component system phosphate regulon sensor histidine kinase PhoR